MYDKKILIASMKYGYGKNQETHSYEWNHFYLGLKDYFSEVNFFDFVESYRHGRGYMQDELLSTIKSFKPDVLLFVPHINEFDSNFVNSLRKHVKTCGFFHDDSWRTDYVKKWASNFDVFTTTDANNVGRYAKVGLDNAVFLPFGVNESFFVKDNSIEQDIDISFIGSWHPYREWLIRKLKKNNIAVEVFGAGWNDSQLLLDNEMVDVMQRSKICLNLSNSINFDIRYLLSSPRAVINTLRSPKNKEQVKGRHFEIPACGSMQLSYFVEGLEELFDFGKDIVIFNSPEELIEKANYYLRNNDERIEIANAGYQRVVCNHTYGQRFTELFKRLGWVG